MSRQAITAFPGEREYRREQHLHEVPGVAASLAQGAIYKVLAGIDNGYLTITDHLGKATSFGNRRSVLRAHCIVSDPAVFERVLGEGSLGLGETYAEGLWNIGGGRVADFFRILFANRLEYRIAGRLPLRIELLLRRLFLRRKTIGRARREIQSHYDLGNDFYRLVLDPSMTYSCGYQLTPADSLEQMQEQKYGRIYRKLGLERGGKLVDIGCGWGGMLVHAARRNRHIRGVGVTLSEEQFRFVKDRIAREGLGGQIEVRLCDYRELRGSFDFLVSIGMFEHVGRSGAPIFFRKMRDLLAPGGAGLLHTIGLEEGPAVPTDPWILRYIFPGGRLPRLEELVREMRSQGFTVGHIENLRPHYALTLKKWRENFISHRPEIEKLGIEFNRQFIRRFDYYLQMSEACFCDSTTELYQLLFCNGRTWTFPLRFEF
jgi:cyclopropane-fatty-acyl-phospholipid synthase